MVCRLGYYTSYRRPRAEYVAAGLVSGLASATALGVGLSMASRSGNPSLATGLVFASALSRPNYGLGYSYGGFGYNYGYCGGFGGFSGMLANSMVNSYNFGSSLYCDLDAPRGVASVSPLVNSAINYPFSYSGMFGSCLIGGYI